MNPLLNLRRISQLGAALSIAGAPSFAQGFVERAAAVGLVHEFSTGLDRVGNWAPMADWIQQGLALGDLDGDVDPDVVAVSRLMLNSVFRNDGGTFTDVSATAEIDSSGFDSCAALGDYDRDGDLDLFVGALEHGEGPAQARSRLYRNDGGFAFSDVTRVAGTVGHGHTLHAAFVDLDQDGMLDLYTSEFHGTNNRFYRNEGDGSFTEMAAELGLATGGSTHVTAFFDVDGDGRMDVLPGEDWKVSNAADFVNNSDDVHLQHQADGTFTDVTAGSDYAKTGPPSFGSSTMGIAVGDVDYDGDFDVYQTEVNTQFLMLNNGWPTSGLPWVKAQDAYGVANPLSETPTGSGQTVGWGCVFFDADLDLWLDLYKVNGHVSPANPRNQRNYFWRGQGPGAGFAFVDETFAFGLGEFYDARGISWGDVDADGDIDLFTCPPSDMLRFYENQVDRMGQGWIAVRPVCGTSAPGGFGVLARWTDSLGYPHIRQIGADGVTGGQAEFLAHFGIGYETDVDLDVEFPSGMTLAFPSTAPNTWITAVEPVMIELPARVLPTRASGTVQSGLGTAITAPSSRRFSVVVHAYAQDGTPLDRTAAVTIEIPGVEPASAVQHVAGNTFTRAFALPDVPGRRRVEVSFNGWELLVQPTIAFRGEVDHARTTTALVPEAARAGSGDLIDVVVVPRDANGCLVPCEEVQISSGGTIPLASLAPVGDGSFKGTITAPATAGSYVITPKIDGVTIGQPATLPVAAAALGSASLFYDEVPNENVAMDPNEYKLLVTPRDFFGRPLGPQADLDVIIQLAPGSVAVTQKTDGYLPSPRVGGDFLFVFEKPLDAPANSAFGSLKFTVNGVTLFTKPFTF